MLNSTKFAFFSLVGYITFTIVSIFFPFISIVSLAFGALTAISFMVSVFGRLKTKHHFLLSALSAMIGLVSSFIMLFIFGLTNVATSTDIITTLAVSICSHFVRYSLVMTAICWILYLLDLLLVVTMKLEKERNNRYFKWFRFSVYCTVFLAFFSDAMASFEIIQAVLQLIMLCTFVVNVISLFTLIFKQTKARRKTKSIVSLGFNAIFSAVLGNFILISGDGLANLFDFGEYVEADIISYIFTAPIIGMFLIYKVLTMLFVIALLIVLFVFMVTGIFTVKKKFIHNFAPILYAAIGLVISGIGYSYLVYTMFYFEHLTFPFYITMLVFSVGIAISFMATVYKLIFVNKGKDDAEKIDIDLNVDEDLGDIVSEISKAIVDTPDESPAPDPAPEPEVVNATAEEVTENKETEN